MALIVNYNEYVSECGKGTYPIFVILRFSSFCQTGEAIGKFCNKPTPTDSKTVSPIQCFCFALEQRFLSAAGWRLKSPLTCSQAQTFLQIIHDQVRGASMLPLQILQIDMEDNHCRTRIQQCRAARTISILEFSVRPVFHTSRRFGISSGTVQRFSWWCPGTRIR